MSKEQRYQDIQRAAHEGIAYGCTVEENRWNVIGYYEEGPVEYNDPRINVVTRVLLTMTDPWQYNKDLSNPSEAAEVGNAIIYALDYFKEHHE